MAREFLALTRLLQSYPNAAASPTFSSMGAGSAFTIPPSQHHQNPRQARLSDQSVTADSDSDLVRRSFEEPDGPAATHADTTTVLEDNRQQLHQQQSQATQLQQQRQHRASASASGLAVEAKLKEIARGAGRTQSLDLSSQLLQSMSSSAAYGSGGTPPSSGSGSASASSSFRHQPSASVDHVGRAFSHMGLQ